MSAQKTTSPGTPHPFQTPSNCTLTGINPYIYFRDTFDHLARGWPARLIGELLPQASATAERF